jgi:hypothetical protein
MSSNQPGNLPDSLFFFWHVLMRNLTVIGQAHFIPAKLK